MKVLGSASDFAAHRGIKVELVPLPSLGEDVGVHVRSFGADQLDEFMALVAAAGGKAPKARDQARLAAMCVCDAEGVRIYGDEHLDALREFDPRAVVEIVNVAMRLSGLTEAALAAEKKD